jgi:hypothetical protein
MAAPARSTEGLRVSTPAGLACLAVVVAATMWRSLGGSQWLFVPTLAATVALIAVELRHIPRNLRHTALVLVAASVPLLFFARDPLDAVGRGVLVGGLFVSLMAAVALLGVSATRHPRVGALRLYLRAQPPGRRYLGFSLASQFFSSMLSLAAANILFMMASSYGRGESTTLVVAVTRGFIAAIMWSPMFGNMAILLALYPSLQWTEVFPLGFLMGQATVLIGFMLYRPAKDSASEDGEIAPGGATRAVAPLIAVPAAFLGSVIATSSLLGLGTTATIVLLTPVAAWLLNASMAEGRSRLASGARRLGSDLRRLPSLASEATLLMSAGCAGTIMASAFPERWARQIGEALNGSTAAGIAALMTSLILFSLVGVHPVLSAVFLASAFTPALLGLPPLVHFCALIAGWGVATVVTPFSMLSMMASRYSGIAPFQLSLGENWRFTIACTATFTVVLAAVAALLG